MSHERHSPVRGPCCGTCHSGELRRKGKKRICSNCKSEVDMGLLENPGGPGHRVPRSRRLDERDRERQD